MNIREILDDIKSPRKKKVILDTDAHNEIDDQYAIAYCYLSDSMDVVAACAEHYWHDSMPESETNNPEYGMYASYEEIKKILNFCDSDYKTPVFKGSTTTMDKVGGAVESEAADAIIRIARESDEIVYVLAIGAITNVSSAIMKAPDIREKICVIWLGCNQFHLGHPMEFNLSQDIEAGRYLFDCAVPLVVVPACWVTSILCVGIDQVRDLRGHNALGDYLADITEERYEMAGKYEGWARTIWDIGAPAIIETPENCEFDVVKAPIITDDVKYAFDDSRHEVIVVNELKRDPIVKRTWELIKSV